MANPADLNNPFALIQKTPDPWKGLTGKDSRNLLIFDKLENGVRAGYINLRNTYLRRGLNTPSLIFPVYAPKTPNQNPDNYIKLIEQFTGIKANDPITENNLFLLGKGITRVETGRSIPVDKLLEGWNLSLGKTNAPTGSDKSEPEGGNNTPNNNTIWLTIIATLLAAWGFSRWR